MHALLAGLARNLVMGARLALFLGVRRLDFRASPADFVVLFAFNFALWLVAAALREGRYGELFAPLVPGRVGLYVCGMTVQDKPHIGHSCRS